MTSAFESMDWGHCTTHARDRLAGWNPQEEGPKKNSEYRPKITRGRIVNKRWLAEYDIERARIGPIAPALFIVSGPSNTGVLSAPHSPQMLMESGAVRVRLICKRGIWPEIGGVPHCSEAQRVIRIGLAGKSRGMIKILQTNKYRVPLASCRDQSFPGGSTVSLDSRRTCRLRQRSIADRDRHDGLPFVNRSV
jgi:hypothetical protein